MWLKNSSGAKSPVTLELPHQWLWEIIDEFVYQFQSFALFRCSLHKKSAEELDFIRQNPTLWNIHSVLNVLYSLVDKSNINQQLEVVNEHNQDQFLFLLTTHLHLGLCQGRRPWCGGWRIWSPPTLQDVGLLQSCWSLEAAFPFRWLLSGCQSVGKHGAE